MNEEQERIEDDFKTMMQEPEKHKSDQDYLQYCKDMISGNPRRIAYISKDNTHYDELCEYAVRRDGRVIELMDKESTRYTELCVLAVCSHKDAISVISQENVKNYEELEDLAIANFPGAIAHIPRYQGDKEKVINAAVDSPSLLKYASDEIKRDPSAVAEIIKNGKLGRGKVMEHVAPSMLTPDSLVKIADLSGKSVKSILEFHSSVRDEERAVIEAQIPEAKKRYEKEKERNTLLEEAKTLKDRLNEIEARLAELEAPTKE